MQRRTRPALRPDLQGTDGVNALFGRAFLLLAYAVYVLSNATALQLVLPTGLRHATFILIAAAGLVRCPHQVARAVLVALPVALIYVAGDLPLYAAMVFVFACAIPLLSEGVRSIVARRDWRYLYGMALISLVPALLSVDVLLDEGLFDTTYGRERVLLGFLHPKEAGVSFAAPILLMMMCARGASALPWIAATAFLWLVGSRNASLLVPLAYALRRHFSWTLVALMSLTLTLGAMALFYSDWYDIADTLVSFRLTVWSEVLDAQESVRGLDMLSGERFGADNFFVEAFLIAGNWAAPLLVCWVATVHFVSGRASPLGVWPRVSLVLLLFFGCFDSGIASTGNFMHALLWAVALTPLLARRRVRRRSPRFLILRTPQHRTAGTSE